MVANAQRPNGLLQIVIPNTPLATQRLDVLDFNPSAEAGALRDGA